MRLGKCYMEHVRTNDHDYMSFKIVIEVGSKFGASYSIFDGIRQELARVDWEGLFASDKWNAFKSEIRRVQAQHIPEG